MNIANLKIVPEGLIRSGTLVADYADGRLTYVGSIKIKVLGPITRTQKLSGIIAVTESWLLSRSWMTPDFRFRNGDVSVTSIAVGALTARAKIVGPSFDGVIRLNTELQYVEVTGIQIAAVVLGKTVNLSAVSE